MTCVLPGLVVGALGSQSQSLCPVTLFMMAGYRTGDTWLNLAVSPSAHSGHGKEQSLRCGGLSCLGLDHTPS